MLILKKLATPHRRRRVVARRRRRRRHSNPRTNEVGEELVARATYHNWRSLGDLGLLSRHSCGNRSTWLLRQQQLQAANSSCRPLEGHSQLQADDDDDDDDK